MAKEDGAKSAQEHNDTSFHLQNSMSSGGDDWLDHSLQVSDFVAYSR